MLIGITGRPGAGQDAVADYLASSDHHFTVVCFDRPLRRMLQAGFHLTEEHFRTDLFHAPLPQLKKSPEQLLHSLRWSWIRGAVDPDTLIAPARDALHEANGRNVHVVIPDVCTESEAALVREHGGRMLHLVKASGPQFGPDPRIKLVEFDRELHVTTHLFRMFDELDAIVGEEEFCEALA